ncbi:MAG: GNAT family N-acetyltransferase [Bacteroidota bacterium]
MQAFKNDILDFLLARGYYRMGSTMFTTAYLESPSAIFPVHWLRYRIADVTDAFFKTRNFTKLSNKYEICYVDLNSIKDDLNLLFSQYRLSTKFAEPETLDSLWGAELDSFDSRVITVKDNGELIAAGIFDIGKYTVAAIKNFYDPRYAREGLGIFLLMELVRYCRAEAIPLLYPGYIVPGIPNFDYKVKNGFSSLTEVFLEDTQQWIGYRQWIVLQEDHSNRDALTTFPE